MSRFIWHTNLDTFDCNVVWWYDPQLGLFTRTFFLDATEDVKDFMDCQQETMQEVHDELQKEI